MLRSQRVVSVPDLGAELVTDALVHRSFRVHVVSRRGVVSEDELLVRGFARVGRLDRSVLTVLLDGRARIRAGGDDRALAAGDVCAVAHKGSISMRQEGEPYRSVVLEWDPDAFGPAAPALHGRLDPAALARVNTAADALMTSPEPTRALHDLLTGLQEAGLPVRPPDPPLASEPAPARLRALSRALDQALSHVESRPMLVDLHAAVGLSPRQLQRAVGEFNQRYGFNALGWRDARSRSRVFTAATLLTAPGATPARVARAVGYGSTPALYRAFAEARLPPPGEVARAVRELG